MYKLILEDSFVAAHKLQDSKSLTTKKCLNLHGHLYRVKIEIETNKLKNEMVIDFGELKSVIQIYDHDNLNKWFNNPTVENIVQKIYNDIKSLLFKRLTTFTLQVTVKESDNTSITYNEKKL